MCPGDENGVLPSSLFAKVVHRKKGKSWNEKKNVLKVKYFQNILVKKYYITTFLSKYFFIVSLLVAAAQQSPEFLKKEIILTNFFENT